jgi:hypothetical protein
MACSRSGFEQDRRSQRVYHGQGDTADGKRASENGQHRHKWQIRRLFAVESPCRAKECLSSPPAPVGSRCSRVACDWPKRYNSNVLIRSTSGYPKRDGRRRRRHSPLCEGFDRHQCSQPRWRRIFCHGERLLRRWITRITRGECSLGVRLWSLGLLFTLPETAVVYPCRAMTHSRSHKTTDTVDPINRHLIVVTAFQSSWIGVTWSHVSRMICFLGLCLSSCEKRRVGVGVWDHQAMPSVWGQTVWQMLSRLRKPSQLSLGPFPTFVPFQFIRVPLLSILNPRS